jgi:hypothetical protein
MNSLLKLWDAIAVSMAVITLVVIAIGLMIGLVELPTAIKRIGLTFACLILVLVLPPIVVCLWHGLSLWQQLGLS